jgi:hypothetical protein
MWAVEKVSEIITLSILNSLLLNSTCYKTEAKFYVLVMKLTRILMKTSEITSRWFLGLRLHSNPKGIGPFNPNLLRLSSLKLLFCSFDDYLVGVGCKQGLGGWFYVFPKDFLFARRFHRNLI